MTDVLLTLSNNRLARKLVSSAKLPIPMPERLERLSGPRVPQPQFRAIFRSACRYDTIAGRAPLRFPHLATHLQNERFGFSHFG